MAGETVLRFFGIGIPSFRLAGGVLILGDREVLEKGYDRLIVLDPEVSSREDAERWTRRLLEDLEELRKGVTV